MKRHKLLIAALAALVFAGGGWVQSRPHPAVPAPPAAGAGTGSTCAITTLPAEARDTVRRIHSGGPIPFPRSDGAVFGNREGHLPEQRRGYYHEYTVITPRSQGRSLRRIVTGGTPLTNPTQYFYSGNHYDSFCLVTGAGSQ